MFALLVATLLVPSPDLPITRLTDDGREVIRPTWSADGRHLLFAREEQGGTAIWQYVLPVDPPGPPRRLTGRSSPEYHGVVSPDGRRVLITIIPQSGTQGNCDLAAVDFEGSNLATVVDDQGGRLSHQEWPSWSPDGERFVFSSTHEANQEIYTARSDGSDPVRLTQSPGHDAHPSWSARDGRIVFATDRWGNLELAGVRPDGTGLVRLTESPGLDDYPSVSPGGRFVAFVSNRDRQFEIYLMDLDDPARPPVNLSRHPGRDTMPSWTADGLGVTFVSDRDGGADIYTVDVSRLVEPSGRVGGNEQEYARP